MRGQFEPELEDLPPELAEAIAEEARRLCPVGKTGTLKRSIRAVGGVVYIDAFYASFVEYGTIRATPKPFIHPAIENVAASHSEG